MIKGVYCVYDRLTGYLAPAVENSDAEAVRNFEHSVLNSGTLLMSHSQDYSLIRVAWFDTKNGQFMMEHPQSGDLETRCPSHPLSDAYSVVLAAQSGGTHV